MIMPNCHNKDLTCICAMINDQVEQLAEGHHDWGAKFNIYYNAFHR